MTCRRTSSLPPPDARPQAEEPAADPLTDRERDVWGEDCQELLTEVTKAKKLGTIPSDDARSFWNDALGAFEHGAGECVAGTAAMDSPRASEGIRDVQKGIGRLAAAMSLIRGDLEGR